jgi:hypothetical protein
MSRDVREIVGLLMRALGEAEISLGEVEDAAFAATGHLEGALNHAYIKLLEFAHDREARLKDPRLDHEMREGLEQCLKGIGKLGESSS